MAKLKPVDGSDVYLWKYLPSIPAAAAFLGLFGLVTAFHCWRTVKTKSWFCIPFAIGGLFQVIGYGIRIAAHYQTNDVGTYVLQTCFILLAPIFYAATIYMLLGRIIRVIEAERLSLIPVKWLTRIFVTADVVALLVQGNASGLTAKDSTQKLGEGIITGGLFIQLVAFGFFIIVAGAFHWKLTRDCSAIRRLEASVPWRAALWMTYACSALIMIRSIFRIIEYISGTDSYLLTHEWPAYVFDAGLMWAIQVVFAVWFPDQFAIGSPSGKLMKLMDWPC